MVPLDWKIKRLHAGLTQHEAGLLIEIPSYMISALETGRSNLTPVKLEAYRAALEAACSRRQSISA